MRSGSPTGLSSLLLLRCCAVAEAVWKPDRVSPTIDHWLFTVEEHSHSGVDTHRTPTESPLVGLPVVDTHLSLNLSLSGSPKIDAHRLHWKLWGVLDH
ncbi:hypothetical protein ACFQL7_27730 [Halocatena marina]|uniref:Secreted protein n=1 Tax=Halocatena marina TaxID=2934937 RepID=A0ABD5YYK4_9EURY